MTFFFNHGPLSKLVAALGRFISVSSFLLMSFALFVSPRTALAATCYYKPAIIAAGQDPSVVFQGGNYYLVQSNRINNDTQDELWIRKSKILTELGNATNQIIWTPPASGPYSHELWAPELEYINNTWYIYFAADDAFGSNQTHRMYVIQNTVDPTIASAWSSTVTKVYDPQHDNWAIDGSVFNYNNQLYMIWSGWPGTTDGIQNLYIAKMSNPTTLSTSRSLIGQPGKDQNGVTQSYLSWEDNTTKNLNIEEGPEAFFHNGQLSIVYSANYSGSEYYKLGMLKLTGTDPTQASSWTKSAQPIFSEYTDANGSIYGPGHNSAAVTSPDGTES